MRNDAPPDALRRQGIVRATDNAEGAEMRLPRGWVMQHFGAELRERFLVRPRKECSGDRSR